MTQGGFKKIFWPKHPYMLGLCAGLEVLTIYLWMTRALDWQRAILCLVLIDSFFGVSAFQLRLEIKNGNISGPEGNWKKRVQVPIERAEFETDLIFGGVRCLQIKDRLSGVFIRLAQANFNQNDMTALREMLSCR